MEFQQCSIIWMICLSTDVIEGIPHDTGLLQYVMHMLATEDIEGLPPGGGINAKYVELTILLL